MRVTDLILKKQKGYELTREEIAFLIKGFTLGTIPEYQVSAWAMAVYFQGMSSQETADLTIAMVESGEQYSFLDIEETIVDKHSTGGVGDTTTLVLLPLVSAAGLSVAKMSGKSLGHAGGTIDKLQAIPQFLVEQTRKDFINQIRKYGIGIISQTDELTPADKKLYALRDVTSTVTSIPLIASSIMSKKIACGADKIVLDVKVGNGAFIEDFDQAIDLANTMINIGKKLNKETIAIISDMDEPLGYAIGNTLEIVEAVNTLKGKGPRDLEELCLTLGSYMLFLGGKCTTLEQSRDTLIRVLANGKALDKFKELISLQGGNPEFIDDVSKLPTAQYTKKIYASSTGYINKIEANKIGTVSMLLGGGRQLQNESIDYSAGVLLKKKVGNKVDKGELIAELYYNHCSSETISTAEDIIRNAINISVDKVRKNDLVKKILIN
ncbi:pyrimidine-nucleoside phosphorylase [Priestia filamentosa]|uniref:pyrimidine-nucleoside phosphorylase n=1 Tax=Priestia filamentosa TaxID=1402861 RepID=UPI001FB212B3|nr:pyrimidine-nucleoside phosphorylase [Priestia filamentosa]UOE58270.1 pyrimidine-nucleoside phosphorylase [Priestia filamentosa]